MAKQTSRAKPTTPVLILREKQRPKAFLLEAEGAAKLTEGAFTVVDKVVDAFEGDTIFSVFVRDSFAMQDKHKIDLTIKNATGHGLYIESVSVRIPKPKKEDSAIAKGGILAVGFSNSPSKNAGLGERPPDNPVAAGFFPKKINPQEQLDFRLTRDLLDRKRFQEKPYLIAEIAFSKLDAKTEDKAEIPFRIRWS
jgi:hypothetical protein